LVERKVLDFTMYCADCKIECVETENGFMCPACGADVTTEELEET